MNYIWDIIIRSIQEDFDLENLSFSVAKRYSPYMELSEVDINFTKINEVVEVNPYYRYYEIFKDMFGIDNYEDEEFRKQLFDITIHFLAQIDILQGMCKKEYYMRFIYSDIKNEIYGSLIKHKMEMFDKEEKRSILLNLLRLYVTGDMIYLLKDTVRRVFKKSIIYANYEVKDELLFYIPYLKNMENEKKLDFIMELFLPVKFRTEVYWGDHFGVIGVDETMAIDKIALY